MPDTFIFTIAISRVFKCFVLLFLYLVASSNGHVSVVGYLLSVAKLNIEDKNVKGTTALHLAAENGKLEVVSLLLKDGAKVGTLDMKNLTTLHYAATNGDVDVIKMLLKSDNSTLELEDVNGNTPLLLAAWEGNSDAVKYFIQEAGEGLALIANSEGDSK